MSKVEIDIPVIPHGHGMSFKRGVADGILGASVHKQECHETHIASYQKGLQIGKSLIDTVADHVAS